MLNYAIWSLVMNNIQDNVLLCLGSKVRGGDVHHISLYSLAKKKTGIWEEILHKVQTPHVKISTSGDMD